MSRPLVLLGNARRTSFILSGKHNQGVNLPENLPSVVYRSIHYELRLEAMLALSPPEGAIVYHGYVPKRQLDILRAQWGQVAAFHRVVMAEAGYHRVHHQVPPAFLALFEGSHYIAQEAWDLWSRAHHHADEWLGPAASWSAYDLVGEHGPTPPPPEPHVTAETWFRRWRRGLLRGVEKA